MAYSVINGAVGKSPAIEKINQISSIRLESKAVEELEQLVLGNGETQCPVISCSFDKCREQIRFQLSTLRDGKLDEKQ